MFQKFISVLATWFGCGRSPFAPGTVGTVGALPLFYLISLAPPMVQATLILLFVMVTIAVAQAYESFSAHDAPEFVMDEVAGFLVTMVFVPASLLAVASGFVLFRLLDIVKPFPISYVDRRVQGAIGTVGDDLLAGILANIIMQGLLHFGAIT